MKQRDLIRWFFSVSGFFESEQVDASEIALGEYNS